jgi:crotonobetainyl-CoA:carnitine CoA-transferase CaiB-like acyl-CoA transferase
MTDYAQLGAPMRRSAPLGDVRIIAVEQYGAGPFGSLHLADLGAEVIKIEDPRHGGDVSRYIPPFQHGEDSLFFEAFNRNKRSLGLDIANPAGRVVFEDLVKVSDAVYSNMRGDVPDRLGLRYANLAHLNRAIVCVSLSGFGMTGPRATEPGYDPILQALAGWMSLTGDPSGPPTKSGISLVDYAGGYVAAMSLLAALHAARRDGIGADCDVSLYDTAVSLLTYPAIWYLNGGIEPERKANSAHPSLIPFQAFEATDGWLTVACAKEKFWQRLTVVLGMPELASDRRFVDFDARRTHSDSLNEILEGAFHTDSVAGWIDRLTAAGVPCGPVRSLPEALEDPHTIARGLIIETDHPRLGIIRQVGSSVRVGDGPSHHRAGPSRNEAADYALRSILGYDEARIADLTRSGAFGPVSLSGATDSPPS